MLRDEVLGPPPTPLIEFRVLAVGECHVRQQSLDELLSRAEHSVVEAAAGEDGEEALHRVQPRARPQRHVRQRVVEDDVTDELLGDNDQVRIDEDAIMTELDHP